MFVHYYLETDTLRNASIKHAIFELSCRAGILFKISSWDGVTDKSKETQSVCIYLSTESSNNRQVHYLKGEIKFLDSDSGLVLSTGVDSIAGLIIGAEKLLSFDFEKKSKFDIYGRIIYQGNDVLKRLNAPILENNSSRLMDLLLQIESNLTKVKKPWGNKCVVSVTHDVDGPFLKDLFSLLRSLVYASKGNKKEARAFAVGVLARLFGSNDPYEMFLEWLSVGKKWGQQSFYFYPGKLKTVKRHKNDPHYEIDSRIQRHLEALIENGQEIGLHSGINCLSKSDFEESKYKLEKKSRSVILGLRGHYWTGVWKKPLEHWQELHEVGFSYDASLNPQGLGFRSGISLPIVPSFRYSEDLDNAFIVLPTAVMDYYAVHSRKNNDGDIIKTLNSCIQNGLCILDWHERVLSNLGLWKGYPSHLFNVIKALEAEHDLIFLSAQEVSNQWSSYLKKCYMGTS